jgi:ATP-dependent helicase Lhr and Lhr-like helicase
MTISRDNKIEFKKKPDEIKDIINILNPYVKKWFFSKYKDFSLPQEYAVTEIHSRKNVLISAPTGATKTLTGFLSIINELVDISLKNELKDKVYSIYISPLKALNYDIEVNLIKPLKEIEQIIGKELEIRIGVRTGDTTISERLKMVKKPPHILITTPESLAIMLSSIKFRNYLKEIEWCIIDEIHSLAENKRGVHLSLLLEEITYLSPSLTRIGLSATIAPLDEIARFLVGPKRNCLIIDVTFMKEIDLKVLSPVKNFLDVSYSELNNEIYEKIDKLVSKHKTTLIFTNTRAATERVVHNLKEKYPKKYNDENSGAHHGSLSKEIRHNIEERLRKGNIKIVVCSTSLELGIDIGFIDLVILLGSPKSTARALQRCGRSGHQLNKTAKGRIIVSDRDDLIECSVLLKNAIEKKIDTIFISKNCLDVLSQFIIGFALSQEIHKDKLYNLIKNTYSYENLSESDFNNILDYLSGKHINLEEKHVYGKININEEGIIRRKGKLGRVIYMTNLGTIPDETNIQVKIGNQIIGTIDEGFLEKLKKGDVFVLGGSTYSFNYAKGMVAFVNTSIDRPPNVPRWVSEMLPLSFDLANSIGKFRRLIKEKFDNKKSKDEIIKFLNKYLYIDDNAAEAIYSYFEEQHKYLFIPNDKEILIEIYSDENQTYYIFHTLYGRRVNDCLSRALAFAIGRLDKRDVEVGINDNGFYLTSSKKMNPIRALSYIHEDKFEILLLSAIDNSEVLKRRFRHAATRSFMILRKYKGKEKNVGRQQVSSQILINSARNISQDFPILKEARREVLEDMMDIKNAKIIISKIEKKEIKIKEIATNIPSPFSFNLIAQGFSDIIKIEDKQSFLIRMHHAIKEKIKEKNNKKIFNHHEKINLKDFVKDLKRESLTFEQRRLIKEALKLDIDETDKTQIINIIKEENIEEEVYNIIKNMKNEILSKWDKNLGLFILKKAQEHFSYESFWDKKEEEKKYNKEEEKELLKKDLFYASKKSKLDFKIYEDLKNKIEDKKHTINNETKEYKKNLLKKTVPKQWSDKLIKFLKNI